MALKALWFWRRPPPVTTVSELAAFVETRAKFVAQTSLYTYIKARAGTRYYALMEDDTFIHSVNIAKWEIYLACLGDFATYAAARVGAAGAAPNGEVSALAIDVVDAAIAGEEIPAERPQGFAEVGTAYTARAQATDWAGELGGDTVFQNSLTALVEWAPIADELKRYDVEAVKTAMRFKWKKVRDQFEQILDADAVLADWRRSRHG